MKSLKNKIRVCLLFGGKSTEHEVSLLSAKSVYEALDKNKYEVILVGIDKQGRWLLGDKSNYLLNPTNPKLIALNQKIQSAEIIPLNRQNQTSLIALKNDRKKLAVDVFFPLTHGTYGEDGCLQGFLELTGSPYVGAGVLGSAVGMDKDVQKRLLNFAKIPTAKFIAINKSELNREKLNQAVKILKFPIFVKPATLGSSVGVSKTKNLKQLKTAIKKALEFDNKILLEEFIPGREIECSVLGTTTSAKASLPGEVAPTHEFYSYTAKYLDENGAALIIPAKLPKPIIKKVQTIAVNAFKTLECYGMARVDFFLTKDNKVYVNEINTIPGFTKISMYPKLWAATGISYPQLLDELIQLALSRHQENKNLKRTYI